MHWLKRKVSKRPRLPTKGQREADRALGRAEEALRTARSETSEILESTEELKRLGRQDDFAARIREAMGGT